MLRSSPDLLQELTPLQPQPLSLLRSGSWSTIPTSPGVYWWYFPPSNLDLLRVRELCDVSQLKLRSTSDGKVCLYHGLANNLSQRIAWHAAQKLTHGTLTSGFLSTFRLSLLALNDFNYSNGAAQIDAHFDTLSVSWQPTRSREEAQTIEHAELRGDFHYPLNIQGNNRTELASFVRHLKSTRKAYKLRHSQQSPTSPG